MIKNQYKAGETWYNPYNDRTYVFNGEYWQEALGKWNEGELINRENPRLITDNFRHETFMIAEPEFVGRMPARREIEIIPAEKPKKKTLGWCVSEIMGMSIINPIAVKGFEVQRESSDAFWLGLENRL